ncbi:flagellar motor switch protein FliN [Balneolaceae bacterium ANBcel3]|nr:flagellar motor switch protein FliN [Balneolaceae bacterium ANBcel3]
MNIDNWKSELEKNLPDVEKFLTSVLQEESKVAVVAADSFQKGNIKETLDKNDIFVYAKDDVQKCSVILVLDKEWFGLLSSIMMGVEEKESNEITRDLLKKFSTELSVTLKKSTRQHGINFALGDIEVLTLRQLEKKMDHDGFFHAKMTVSGLADDDVRAEIIIGDPEAITGQKKEEPKEEAETGEEAIVSEQGEESQEFSQTDPSSITGSDDAEPVDEEQVITGRKVEFDDFDPSLMEGVNGNSRSMALLKDVEMEVSVQLGQIEMPLGKVLQLAKGSIIELDKLAGEPVDILVNNSKIAQGEVVVIDEHFGVRISNLITTRERIANLK